jgi:hypothetical protein
VRRTVLVMCLLISAGCSNAPVTSGSRLLAGTPEDSVISEESIPAEWKVAEDTTKSGQVTTASVQLPAERSIEGLMNGETPHLALRCLHGVVTAYIVVDQDGTGDSTQTVPVELDAAPACQ